MIKNITIQEGGIALVFIGIRKLLTRQSGSDEKIPWVSESDRQLTTKYITQNGVYRASDDGYYAYSSVTVSAPTNTGVTGEGEDGEQHYVTPDPETGELVDEILPSSIDVSVPPIFLGPYGDGAYISFEGIEVKAYKADDTIWEDESYPGGVIPVDELVFPVTIAQYDPDAYSSMESDEISTAGLNSFPITSGNYRFTNTVTNNTLDYVFSGGEINTLCAYPVGNEHLFRLVAAGASRFEVNYQSQENGGEIYRGTISPESLSEYTYDGKTVYYTGGGGFTYYPSEQTTVNSSYAIANSPPDNGIIAWIMVYGTRNDDHWVQIPVDWQRPGDGAVLEDTFGIIVVDTNSGGNGEA